LIQNTVYNKRNKLKLIITLRIKLKRFLKYLKLISWIRLNLIGYQNKYPEELNTILQSFELGNIFKRILFISLSIQNIETFDNGR
jgi:virulence-associated protein VapD